MTHSETNNFDLRTLWNLLIVKKQRRVWACNRTRKKIAIFVQTVAVKRVNVDLDIMKQMKYVLREISIIRQLSQIKENVFTP